MVLIMESLENRKYYLAPGTLLTTPFNRIFAWKPKSITL